MGGPNALVSAPTQYEKICTWSMATKWKTWGSFGKFSSLFGHSYSKLLSLVRKLLSSKVKYVHGQARVLVTMLRLGKKFRIILVSF